MEPCFDTGPDPDSDEGAHFEALIALIMVYEAKHFAMLSPDPIEAIKFSMDQQGLTNRDLKPMIGSRGRVSEVLNGKRRLSMTMVWRLHEGLGTEPPACLGASAQVQLRTRLAARLYRLLGERCIDILVAAASEPNDRLVLAEARRQAIQRVTT